METPDWTVNSSRIGLWRHCLQFCGMLNRAFFFAGGRGFYLINEGVLLNQALIQAALHHGYAQGCSPVMTPFFMRKDIMAECAQLEQFDEELYKVTGAPCRMLHVRFCELYLSMAMSCQQAPLVLFSSP